MKITYSVPTTEQAKENLRVTVQRLFQVEPMIIQRMTDVQVDLASLDALADLLNVPVTQTPHVVFTFDQPRSLSREQRLFVSQPGIEVKREYSPEEVLYEYIQENNQEEHHIT